MDLADIWDGVEVVVCDLDGVVYLGEAGIARSGDALTEILRSGRRLIFVTNNSSKTPVEVADKIRRTTGFAAAPDDVLTSAQVAARRLVGSSSTVFVVGGAAIDVALREVGIEVTQDWRRADAVVAGIDRDLTYGKLADATLAIRAGAAFHATNTDATYPTPEGQLPGGGVMAGALEIATGVTPLVAGKPEGIMADQVDDLAPGAKLVIGDRPETDVALGKRAGWATALVLTGATESPEEIPRELQPDAVVDSLAALAALL